MRMRAECGRTEAVRVSCFVSAVGLGGRRVVSRGRCEERRRLLRGSAGGGAARMGVNKDAVAETQEVSGAVFAEDAESRATLLRERLRKVDWAHAADGAVEEALQQLARDRVLRKFGESEALAKPISVEEMRLYTRQRVTASTLDFTGDQDAALISTSFFTSFAASAALALCVEQFLPGPDYFRYTATFLVASVPFGFLLAGLSLPSVLQAGLILLRRATSKEFRERLVRHEAGHFLVAYLMGVAVDTYRANAISNAVSLSIRPASSTLLSSSASKQPDRDAPTSAARELRIDRYSHEQLDVLAAVSMAGVVSELLCCAGSGRGGYADLMQLQSLMQRADPPLEPREVQQKVRWGAVRAYTLLQQNRNALDALTAAMFRRDDIPACIAAIEAADDVLPDDY